MRSEFKNLQDNDNYSYEVDSNTNKQVVKIYSGENLIAKKVTHKKSIRYFGIQQYKDYLTEEPV